MRSALVSAVLFLAVGFLAGLLGNIGSLHHSLHVMAGVLIAELVCFAIYILLDGPFDR